MPVAKGPNTANFNNCASWNGKIGNVTTVGTNGGPSAYGTYDQTGNVYEWNDLDGATGSSRGLRGGNYASGFVPSSLNRSEGIASYESDSLGFRLSSSSSILNPLNLSYFVTVGNASSINDSTGYGGVNYIYQISQYSVTNSEYAEFLNSVASTDPYGLYSVGMNTIGGISRSGSSGSYTYSVKTNMGNKPVIYVSWFDAARYCNWLHNGKGNGDTETGAYTLNGTTTGNAVAKNFNASYSIPTENEWYKAAYYKGGSQNAGYWDYATQSDTLPECICANAVGDGQLCLSLPPTPTPTTTATPTPTPTITVTPTPSVCPVDQYADYVSLLLYFNGTNGSRDIVDSSRYNHQILPVGDAIISTDNSKFGGSSLYIDGNSDFLTLSNNNEAFGFGTEDFTVESWIYVIQYGSYHTQIFTTTGAFTDFSFAVDNNGKLFYWNGSVGRSVGQFGDVPLNQWTHVAFSRENQTLRLYVNDRLVGTLEDDTNLINTAGICIAANETYPYSSICYLDELRVTKGVARYVTDTLQQYCDHYANTTPTPTPTPTVSPGVTRTPTVTPTISPSPTVPSFIVLPSKTKDELVIQLTDLTINHKYKVLLIPSNDSNTVHSYPAVELDQSEFNFYATKKIKNIRTILIKDIYSKIINVQIIIHDLTTETITTYPNFVKCYDYSECNITCLSGYTYVDVIQNHYRFTFTNNIRFFHPDTSLYKLGYGYSQYILKNIPIDYPLAILNHGYESFISYYGDNSKAVVKNIDGVPYNFYYGDIGIQVNGIGPVPPALSYTSYNNGYMGGQDRLVFDPTCTVVTPTPTVTPTTTPTPTPMFSMMSYSKPITITWDDY